MAALRRPTTDSVAPCMAHVHGHLPGLDGMCCYKRAPRSDSTFFCSAGRFCCSWACCSLSSSPCLCCRRTSFTGSCLESWRLPLASVHLSPLFSDPTTHCGPSSGHHWVCTSMRVCHHCHPVTNHVNKIHPNSQMSSSCMRGVTPRRQIPVEPWEGDNGILELRNRTQGISKAGNDLQGLQPSTYHQYVP